MTSAVHESEHLVQMANDIGQFFKAQPLREDAIAGIENHITSYWTRRMREKLIAQLEQGGTGLDELPHAAVRRLAANKDAKPKQIVGGDAG